jgi:hypothetical protein
VRNLRVEITTPNGSTQTQPADFGKTELILGPGHSSETLGLPQDGGTGKYRIKWLIDVDGRAKPVVIARDSYMGPPLIERTS